MITFAEKSQKYLHISKKAVPLHREKCIEYKNMHLGECKLN